MELSTAVPEAHEKRTITVIQSPPRPAPDEDSAGVTGPAETADSDEDSSRPADPADDDGLVVGAEPAGEDDSAVDAVLAEEEDSAGVADQADHEDSAPADSAGGTDPAGQQTPAETTPARAQTPDQTGQDSMMFEDGSLIFPSFPRHINQASLLDFMSLMTLMQRRMDTV